MVAVKTTALQNDLGRNDAVIKERNTENQYHLDISALKIPFHQSTHIRLEGF